MVVSEEILKSIELIVFEQNSSQAFIQRQPKCSFNLEEIKNLVNGDIDIILVNDEYYMVFRKDCEKIDLPFNKLANRFIQDNGNESVKSKHIFGNAFIVEKKHIG